MPSFKYCPSCAAKNEYSVKPPEKCVKCGKPMATNVAFKVAPNAPDISMNPVSASINKLNSFKSKVRPAPSEDADGFVDYYNQDEAEAIKNEILASLNGGELQVQVPKDTDKIMFGDLVRQSVQ